MFLLLRRCAGLGQHAPRKILAMNRADSRLIIGLAPGLHTIDIDVMLPNPPACITGQNDDVVPVAVAPNIKDCQPLIGFGVTQPPLLIGPPSLTPGNMRLNPY